MGDSWTDKWNERYGKEEFAYGMEPNRYFKEQLDKLEAGTILFPAEGEGRNAVYAAQCGWNVSAFDISVEGRRKAIRLAESRLVSIDYKVGDLNSLDYSAGQFDAIALIYAHFPASIKSEYHNRLNNYLRKDGLVIFEAFSKKHLEYIARNEKVGGPKDIESLFSIEEILADFEDYDMLELEEKEIELNEGTTHIGTGSVIRFVGMKR